MEQQKYKTKVYIKIDNQTHIIAIDADWNISDKTDWICIDEGIGYKYRHPQGNYLDKPLTDMQRCHNYKYINNQVIECIPSDKAAELAKKPPIPPSEAERLASAEAAILALMGGATHV